MTAGQKVRQPSPLQRSLLIVLAALDARQPGTPVPTRLMERLLAEGGYGPVYGTNLRASCRRMEAAGWLRTLRAPNLQLAVELTDSGRAIAVPLLVAERERVQAEQRATQVVVLPLTGQSAPAPDGPVDRPVSLDDIWHLACRADFVVRLNGTTGLQLWNAAGQVTRLAADPLQVALWLQACHDAGIAIRMQINDSHVPEEGEAAVPAPADRTDAWFCQLAAALQDMGISGLTDGIRQAVVIPGEAHRSLPVPARLLHILRESDEAFPLTASRYEEDAGEALDSLLTRAGFTPDQAQELQRHRIRWLLMSQEEYDRRDLNCMLDELERRQMYCRRDQLVDIVFSPVRKPGESWTERLQWLLSTDGFGFSSPLSREDAAPALNYLAGYVGQDAAEALATSVVWAGDKPPEKP
ncbi:hypothetical protein DP804_23240 [Salmonella enterica subsp. enterica]|nr:hypothetical protein [Salmonella enterica subsp. enterica serovar Virchow]